VKNSYICKFGDKKCNVYIRQTEIESNICKLTL